MPRSDPSKKTKTNCPVCGQEFEYYKSWPRKYCSNACKGKANVTNIKGWKPTAYLAHCEQCGKEFEVKPAWTTGRFCSSRCWGDWQSIHRRGEAHPVTGRKFGRPKWAGEPVFVKCAVCGDEFHVKPNERDRRKCCSKSCDAVMRSEVWQGEGNPRWHGGYEPYYGPSWRPAQRAARKRDKVCQRCGVSPDELGKELDVHHIQPFRTFGIQRHREANDLSNLICYCPSCHLTVEWATYPVARQSP